MTHLKTVTVKPRAATSVAPEVKLTFLVDVIEASIPLFQNKNPQNPQPANP